MLTNCHPQRKNTKLCGRMAIYQPLMGYAGPPLKQTDSEHHQKDTLFGARTKLKEKRYGVHPSF